MFCVKIEHLVAHFEPVVVSPFIVRFFPYSILKDKRIQNSFECDTVLICNLGLLLSL